MDILKKLGLVLVVVLVIAVCVPLMYVLASFSYGAIDEQALQSWLDRNGYTAFADATGNLFTQNIFPYDDSLYSIGGNESQYASAYINSLFLDGQEFKGVVAYDYLVYSDNGTYRAINGSTGGVDYSGDNLSIVIQAAIDSLDQGIVWLKGLERPAGLTMKDYVTLMDSYNGQLIFYGNFNHDPYDADQRAIVLVSENETNKPIIAWVDDQGHEVVWLVSHYKLGNGNVHQHFSVETVMSDNSTMATRFEITYGEDSCHVAFHDCEEVSIGETTYLDAHYGRMPINVFYEKLESPASSFQFDDGSGNQARFYRGYLRIVNDASSANVTYYLKLEGDSTTTNYYRQRTITSDTSVSASRSNNNGIIIVNLDQCAFLEFSICRDPQGYVRASFYGSRGDPSVVEMVQTVVIYVVEVSNITDIRFTCSAANGFGIGSECLIQAEYSQEP